MARDTFDTTRTQSSTGFGSSGMNSGDVGSPSYQSSSGTLGDSAARAKSEAARQGSAALDSLKEGAQSLGQQAKERAEGYVEGGKSAVTQNLDDFAQAIRKASDELNEKDQTMASQLVRQAASGLESLSRSVSGASIDDIISSVRRFGRNNPTAFIGGAVLAGLALGRFVRASNRHEAESWERDRHDSWRRSESYGRGEDWQSGGNEGIAPRPYSGSSYAGSSSGSSGQSQGQGSSFSSPSSGFSDSPSRSQGYAGGGMGTDPIQSSGPSSDTDESVTRSSYSSGPQSGSISTGGNS